MASYYIVLSLHILGATVWAGGHLVLAVTILPDALRQHRAATVSEFEQRFERIGLPALAVQIVTGLWLAEHLLGSPANWFDGNSVARTVQVKLGLLIITVGLAVLPETMDGMIDASTTRSPSRPLRRRSGATTAPSSTPMRQVPTGWKMVVAMSPIPRSRSSSVLTCGPGRISSGR